jgi:hypothetical protein
MPIGPGRQENRWNARNLAGNECDVKPEPQTADGEFAAKSSRNGGRVRPDKIFTMNDAGRKSSRKVCWCPGVGSNPGQRLKTRKLFILRNARNAKST